MEIIEKFLGDFDPAALLPDLDSMLGRVEFLLRIAVMAGPLVLLVLGLLYFLLPAKEANHNFGYRFFWGMNSVEAWRFTQKVAGIAWAALGLVLTIVMFFICASFDGKETMDMVWLAARCILWELGLLAVCCVVVDIIVVVMFNSKGIRRRFKKKSSDIFKE